MPRVVVLVVSLSVSMFGAEASGSLRGSSGSERSGNMAGIKPMSNVTIKLQSHVAGDPEECDSHRSLDDQWCGGLDTDSPWAQLSCTPVAYRPFTFNDDNGLDGQTDCGNDGAYLGIMANGQNCRDPNQQGTGKDCSDSNYPNVNSNAWAGDFSGQGKNMDYWVFHGCDGAGLQSDCFGDIKYMERIGYRYTDTNMNPAINDGKVDGGLSFAEAYPQGICETDEIGTGLDDWRTFCKFVHPGTGYVYSDYWGGWWGEESTVDTSYSSENMGTIKFGDGVNDCGDFMSKATGCWKGPLRSNVQEIPNQFGNSHPFSGDGAMFSFMLYQWRCEDSTANHNKFSYPSITDNYKKCFVDNEPGNPGLGYPPHVEIYFGTLTKCDDKDCIKFLKWDSDVDGGISLAIDPDSDAGSGPETAYLLYPVHQDDDVPY